LLPRTRSDCPIRERPAAVRCYLGVVGFYRAALRPWAPEPSDLARPREAAFRESARSKARCPARVGDTSSGVIAGDCGVVIVVAVLLCAVMRRRTLGGTGIDVSAVLFGGGTIGGIGSARETWGKGLTDDVAVAVLEAAADVGINVVDTANTYAGGHSEEVIGAWLARRHDEEMLVATKVGAVVGADGLGVSLTREAVLRGAAESRSRLGRDCIDLYLSHAPDDSTPVGETLEAFAELLEAGSVRAIGACNVTEAQLVDALATADRLGLPRYQWVQNEYNLLSRDDEAGVLPLCMAESIGYTPHSVLAGGILTGRFLPDAPLPTGSAVALRPELHADHLTSDVLRGVQQFASAAERRAISPAALALAWVISHEGVTAALVAPRRPDQFNMVRDALSVTLDTDQRAELAALVA